VSRIARPITVLRDRQAAGQLRRELLGRHLGHPRDELLREQLRHLFRPQPPRKDPLARLGVLQRLRQELMEEQDLDPFAAHHVDERVELLARAAHPDHVVEQQLVAVRGRQALVGEIGPMHDHRAERSDFGVRAQLGCGGSGHATTPFD